MRSAFDHLPCLQHDDFVGIDNRREPVRDDDGGAPFGNAVERRLNFAFGSAVERAGRLVEDQHWRIFQQCPGNGHALLFAAGQL